MATVYQGVGGGGDLFRGQKFFIIQRVPGRNALIKDVERNGGFIVALEKNADVLIADHAKPKLAPQNSFSWKYLEQSIKNGQLEDLETHRIGSSSNTVRPVGSSQPKKLSRTPFTQQDDEVLRTWVTKAELLGLSTKGNEIYEQLEAKNPRHTYQSWRDRWVKYVSHQPRPEVDMGSTEGPVERSHKNTVQKTIPPTTQSKDVTTAPTTSGTRKRPLLPNPSSPATPVPSRIGLPFTEEDIRTLEKEYCDILRLDLAQLVDAWEAFAGRHGRHTAGEWCKYYHNVFKPNKDQELERKKAGMEKSRPETTPVMAGSASGPPVESKDPARCRRISEDKTKSVSPPESRVSKQLSETAVSVVKAKFLEDVRDLARVTSRKIEPRFHLFGCEYELYDLWIVVNKPEFGGLENVDNANKWLEVAAELGINTSRHQTVHTTLRQLYHNILADFDTFCSIRKGEKANGHTTPGKSSKPNTSSAVMVTQTPKTVRMVSSDVDTPVTIRATSNPLQESAHNDFAVQRIRQSVGHGELAFLQSLGDFVRDVLHKPVNFEPTVSKCRISLFNLWDVSLPLLDNFDDVENEEEAWDDVATKLGFEPSKHPSAPDQLRQICDDFLVDYYEFFKLIEVDKAKRQTLQQFEDREESDEEVGGGSNNSLESPSLALQTVRPKAQKRPRNQDSMPLVVEFSPSLPSRTRNKRSRISKGKVREMEIPSTPEHVYNSYLNSEAELSDHPRVHSMGSKVTYFSPPPLTQEVESSPSRQLWSEARVDYAPPSQVDNDEDATQSQTESQLANIALEEFFEHYASQGFDEDIIRQMLQITTLDTELATTLLSDHAKGLDIPDDVAGVWTEEDDNGVRSHRQSVEYKRTVKKHGKPRCLLRREFLEDLEEAEAEAEIA